MRTTRAVTAVFFALAAGAIAGCAGENPAPTFTPRTLPSDATQNVTEKYEEPNPSPEPDAELVPPVKPKFSDEPAEAVEQTLDFYIEAFNYGYQSADSQPLRSISHDACKSCSSHIESIDNMKSNRYSYFGGKVKRGEVMALDETDDGEFFVTVPIMQDEFRLIGKNDEEINSSDAQQTIMKYAVHKKEGMWLIRAYAHGE